MTRSKQTDHAPVKPEDQATPTTPTDDESSEGMLPYKPKEGDDDPDAAAKTPPAKKAEGKKGKAAPPEPIPGLIEGRIVHYVLPNGKSRGEHRAAVVVHVYDHGTGLVDLSVFTRKVDFAGDAHPGHNWFIEKVPFSKIPQEEGHWHFTEKV